MTDKNVTEMTEDTDPALTDLLYGVKDPSGTPLDRKVSVENVLKLAKLGNLVDRGSISVYDWDQTDFTTDGTWRDLDVSSIVPAGATYVQLKVVISDATADLYFGFRPNGSGSANGQFARLQTGGATGSANIFVKLDTNRIIEYMGTNDTFTAINVAVLGWILDNSPTVLGFSDKLINRGDASDWDFELTDITADGTYRELDLSSIVPAGATWVYLKCTIEDGTVGHVMYVRETGSSTAYQAHSLWIQDVNNYFENNFLIPLGTDRTIEYNVEAGMDEVYFVVLGWIMGSAEQALDYAPNDIINPEFSIWQEGTSIDSTTTPANSDDTYIADQWILLSDGNDIADVSRGSSSPPTGSLYFLHSEVETINKKYGFLQPIEAENSAKYAGDKASLSFQAKGTVDNIRAAIISWDGTADTITSDVVSAWAAEGTNPTLATNWTYENTPANIALSTTWVEHQIENIEIDTSGMKNLAVFFWVDDADGAIDETFQLGKVKLELNSVCTKFMADSISKVIEDCQRYCEKSYNLETDPGTATSIGKLEHVETEAKTNLMGKTQAFLTRKRTTPSITAYDLNGNSGKITYDYTTHNQTVSIAGYETGVNIRTDGVTSKYAFSGHWVAKARL